MHSGDCPNCGKEMEKVVGFEGYIWCRDCHITKKVGKGEEENDSSFSKDHEEVTTEILNLIED